MVSQNDPANRELIATEFLGQVYQISCPPEERQALLHAIDALQERLLAARVKSVVGSQRERSLLMLALNLMADVHRMQEELAEKRQLMMTLEGRLQDLVDRFGARE
ncbi:MAG: cell division protein ZapA [Acidithiobacillus sp.]|nr:cell division protein ZapA [Acidithiobacillus sp.]